ncbi:hypothetical protein AB3R30_00865 [Leptolyngbyaceae cyanobacterium UHCC 1019]
MPPIQTLRLAPVTLLLTAGVPLLPPPDFLLPAVAQTVFENQERKAEGDRSFNHSNKRYSGRSKFEMKEESRCN